jgi:hypothetical protein
MEAFYDHMYDYVGAYMFLTLALMLFTGMPVGFALGGVSTLFAFFSVYYLEALDFAVFFQVVQRVWGGDGASGAVQKSNSRCDPVLCIHGHHVGKIKSCR